MTFNQIKKKPADYMLLISSYLPPSQKSGLLYDMNFY